MLDLREKISNQKRSYKARKESSFQETKFNFGSINFEPMSHVAPQQKTEIQLALEQE